MRIARKIEVRTTTPRREPSSGMSPLVAAAAIALAGAIAFPSLAGGGAGADAPPGHDRAAQVACPD